MNYKASNTDFVFKAVAIISLFGMVIGSGLANAALAHEGHIGEDHEATIGTITVNKVIEGETSQVVGNFSFSVNDGPAISFNPSVTNESSKTVGVTIAEESFTIVEIEADGEGYTTTYDNCTDIVAGETCTIINTFAVVEEDTTEEVEVINFDLDTGDSSNDVEIPVVDVETPAIDEVDVEDIEVVEDDNASSTDNQNDNTDETNEEVEYQCEIEGHKYDQSGNPLSDWAIGLMKTVTQDDKKDLFDLDEDITDADGYYCLNWDGETREFRGEGEPTITDGESSLFYSVYEKLVDGWKYLSIEKGPDHTNLAVVPESEVYYGDGFVSTQIGEVNGYIYSNAAYHVDFYNELIEEEDEEEEVGRGNSGPRTSGTRVGDRSRTSSTRTDRNDSEETLSTPEPTPIVAGDQVTVVPTGAPGAGVGGPNNSLTFEQMLFVSERLTLIK